MRRRSLLIIFVAVISLLWLTAKEQREVEPYQTEYDQNGCELLVIDQDLSVVKLDGLGRPVCPNEKLQSSE